MDGTESIPAWFAATSLMQTLKPSSARRRAMNLPLFQSDIRNLSRCEYLYIPRDEPVTIAALFP